MTAPTTNILDTVAYTAGNVVPATRVRPSHQITIDPSRFPIAPFFPDAIVPLQATGGFNTVVELSAPTCLRHAASHMTLLPLDRSVSESELAQLVALGTADGPLSKVASSASALPPGSYCGFRLALTPLSLDFPDSKTVCIEFRADLLFVRPSIEPPRPIPQPDFPFFDPRWGMGLPDLPRGGPVPGPAPMMAMMSGGAPPPPEPSLAASRPAAVASVLVDVGRFTPTAPERPWTVPIGTFAVKCCAPLRHSDDATRCRTVVYADLREAEWTETSPPAPAAGEEPTDIRRVYDAYFADWLDQVSSIVEAPSNLPITPTISLVGRNAGGAAGPEVTNFDVRAFPVTGKDGKALAVAFDIAPGCKGFIEDVDHFIGPYDYGVISDEFVVDRVFRHKWNRGGFDRRVNVQAPTRVKVKRNGNEREEDAIVYGYQDLLTLDWVAIMTESNTRGDYIRLGGQAQTVPTQLRMVADGQTFNAGDVDLGPPEPGEWGIFADLDLLRQAHPDPEIRAFQQQAERDGSRHIARPFAFFRQDGGGIVIKYARVEGVSKHVFCLGDISSVLT